jgi:D-glycero-alpha-D-manno-heptose-7-phosphate kinase
MIISQTPLRISFGGGGTDLSDFWKIEEGMVISSAIDIYIHVIIKKRFDDLIVLNYTKRETVNHVSEIKHELIREALKITGIENGVEITTPADIPSEGSGLGSSSSVTVGLLNAFHTYQSRLVTSEQLAEEACQIEIDCLNHPIGKQDQYIAAHGGLKHIRFNPDGSVIVENVNISSDDKRVFGSNLLLFYTNMTRKASSILSEQKKQTKEHLSLLTNMKNQVPEIRSILEETPPYHRVGKILHTGWQMKQQLADNISNPNIENMYNIAMENGSLGGKITGAGGGGFLLVYVPRENQDKVRHALREYRELPFSLERDGSKIIFNNRR